MACLFFLLAVLLALSTFFNFDDVQFIQFFLMDYAFGVLSENSLPNPTSGKFVFSPIRFLALHLYLGWWSIFNFHQIEVKILFMPMDIQLLCHHLLKTFFLLWNAFAALSKINLVYLKVKVLVTQLCLTLCDPMDSSPPGSSDPGILQARILEWVAMPPPGHLPKRWNPSFLCLLHWQAGSLPLAPP